MDDRLYGSKKFDLISKHSAGVTRMSQLQKCDINLSTSVCLPSQGSDVQIAVAVGCTFLRMAQETNQLQDQCDVNVKCTVLSKLDVLLYLLQTLIAKPEFVHAYA